MQSPRPLLDVLEPRLLLADGQLDTTFSGDGRFTDPEMTAILDMAVQDDGRVVAVGYRNNAMASNSNTIVSRFNEDGTIDASFGQGGRVTIDFGRSSSGRAVAIAGDGDIIVAGGVSGAGSGGSVGSDIALARLNSNGTPDSSFSSDGKLITDLAETASSAELAVDVGIDGQGRIVVAARTDAAQRAGWRLVRYGSNGLLDGSFGDGGIVREPGGTLNAIHVLGNGKVLAAGELDEACAGGTACTSTTAAIVRYTARGLRDTAFGIGGKAVDSIQASGQEKVAFTDLAMQGKKIVAVGLRQTQSDAAVIAARFSGDGIRDNSFNDTPRPLAEDRTVMRDSDVEVEVQPDKKVVIGFTSSTFAGREQKFSVARLHNSGGLDDSFNPRGRLTSGNFIGFTGTFVSFSDGAIIVSSRMINAGGMNGDEDPAVLRDGAINIDFDEQLSMLHGLAIQRNIGRIIAGGRAFDISPGNPEQGVGAMAALEGFEPKPTGPDTEAPRAILQTQHIEAHGTHSEFVVRYIDDRGMKRPTIDNNDIVITGPNGFSRTAKVVRIRGSSDDTRVLYRFKAPGGHWNRPDEGRYTISLRARQISDKAGNFAPAEELKRFRVQFPPA